MFIRFCYGWCCGFVSALPYQPRQCGDANCSEPGWSHHYHSTRFYFTCIIQFDRYELLTWLQWVLFCSLIDSVWLIGFTWLQWVLLYSLIDKELLDYSEYCYTVWLIGAIVAKIITGIWLTQSLESIACCPIWVDYWIVPSPISWNSWLSRSQYSQVKSVSFQRVVMIPGKITILLINCQWPHGAIDALNGTSWTVIVSD